MYSHMGREQSKTRTMKHSKKTLKHSTTTTKKILYVNKPVKACKKIYKNVIHAGM